MVARVAILRCLLSVIATLVIRGRLAKSEPLSVVLDRQLLSDLTRVSHDASDLLLHTSLSACCFLIRIMDPVTLSKAFQVSRETPKRKSE